jgi:hypothetical protein
VQRTYFVRVIDNKCKKHAEKNFRSNRLMSEKNAHEHNKNNIYLGYNYSL